MPAAKEVGSGGGSGGGAGAGDCPAGDWPGELRAESGVDGSGDVGVVGDAGSGSGGGSGGTGGGCVCDALALACLRRT